ncbi:activating transcription factor 7-interacting protein 1 isoform X2 [Leptopilina heterotoma]|uniref:activating transcription factor 7-interacting protein 1 isoform X2 n=1 Tax=Leptopilina heterotoma TaxID=63436 RepID=UPI001CA932E2|nr:activating transcription factor 7-interacting protein 1 isoform X2 [Leptopilina heterotoma]
METKIDILPSNESKKISTVLTTDLDIITKEREEELLNDDEDIDEDGALSDDSLRLKLSDDDEVEQDDVDSTECSYKQLKEEESNEDKKYKEKFATSEEEKDSQQEEFLLLENTDLKKKQSSEGKSEDNFNINQGELIDELSESVNLNSTEIAHDPENQEIIMNGNDPRFYPNSIRPIFENRWSPSNHRMRMGFNSRPPLPPHQRYYPNSNYNNSDMTDLRYYNKYKHYNRVRGTGGKHYHYKQKSGDKKNDVSTNDKGNDDKLDYTADDDLLKSVEEKTEEKESGEKESIENDKGENTDPKVDEINSTELEKNDNEKENIADSQECENVKSVTTESTEDDLPDSLKLDDETPVQSPEKSQINEANPTISAPTNDDDSQEESTKIVDNATEKSDCSAVASDNNDKLDNIKELDKEISENVQTELKLNDEKEISEKIDEDLPKKSNDEMDVEEEENSPTSKREEINVLNEDSGSTMDNLPKVYQCLEEIASMEASRIAEEMKKVEKKSQDSEIDTESIKLKLSQGCDDTDGENQSESKIPPEENDKSNDKLIEKKSAEIDENSIDTEGVKEQIDKDDNIDEEEMSNLTIESTESVNSSSKNNADDKESIEKMNFDDNACHPNEDSKETNVNPTEVTKEKYTNSLYDSLLVKKSDIIMEDISSDKLDASNDVSNDISNDINYDISNDISNDVSNDTNVDVQIKLSEEEEEEEEDDDEESNSQNSVAVEKEKNQQIDVKSPQDEESTIDEIEPTSDKLEASTTNIEKIKEIIGVQEEKMIVDDSIDEESEASKSEKKEEETEKNCDVESSSEKVEKSTDVTMKDAEKEQKEKKQENYLRLKSQTDDTLFAPKTSPVENKEGETSVRQKRRTAKNAEELIKTKFLKSDSEVDSDDSGKYVSVNYKKPKLSVNASSSLSPSTLKRNLGDDEDDVDNEIDSLDRQVTVKKLKMSVDSPKKSSNESLFSFKKDVKRDITKDIKNIGDVKDAKDTKDIKKAKDQESIRNLVHVRKFFQRDIKGKLKKLKQEELEELLIQKIVETITMASEIGKLREQARLSEKNQEATRARCQQLAKQIQDFEMVLKRNAADRSSSNDKFVAPIKINRSVGLQVNFISDQGMQNMRQIQQNAKTASMSSSSSSTSSSSEVGTPHPRKGIKVRSPRRSENIPSVGPPPLSTIPSQAQIQPPIIANPVTPAALVSTKTVSVESVSRTMPLQSINAQQPVISNVNIRSPNKLNMIQGLQQVQQAVILNGNLNANRVPNTTPITVQKAKANNDLIDLTDEEEKTKTTVSTPIVTTATIISNHPQARGNIIQSNATSHYQRVIQAIPTSVALSGQTTNIRVVQPNSQTTPTALVNNINASRMFVMQSGGQPRQILITNPNSIRQNTSSGNRNQFSTITYKTANGIPATANGTLRLVTTQATVNAQITKHPAPLPDSAPCDNNPNWKLPPPAPSLKISKVASGIVLSWNMTLSEKHAEIVSYQLFAYQEVNGTPPSTLLWKKVGDVMALPLPMACTLTQFSAGNNYYFAVRAVDSHSRLGQYSLPGNISL